MVVTKDYYKSMEGEFSRQPSFSDLTVISLSIDRTEAEKYYYTKVVSGFDRRVFMDIHPDPNSSTGQYYIFNWPTDVDRLTILNQVVNLGDRLKASIYE